VNWNKFAIPESKKKKEKRKKKDNIKS